MSHEYAGAGLGRLAGSGAARAKKVVRPLLLVFACVLAMFFLARYAALPILTIRHIVVRSDLPLSEEEVLSISGLRGTEYWHTVPTGKIENRLELNPLIKRARVEKVFPNTLRMTVWCRQPVALILAEAGGRSIPVLVDEEGFEFKIGTTGADVDLPVVSGIEVGESGLGERLPRAYSRLFEDLKTLREKAPSIYRLLSEVRVAPSDAGGESDAARDTVKDRELVLYLVSSPVAIRTRGAIDENLLKYTLMVLDLFSRQGILRDVEELDFRGGEAVYRMNTRGAAGAPNAAETLKEG